MLVGVESGVRGYRFFQKQFLKLIIGYVFVCFGLGDIINYSFKF